MVRRKIGKVPTLSRTLRLVYFLPLSLLLFERVWVPFRTTLNDSSSYLNVETTAVTRKSKISKGVNQENIPTLSELTNSALDWLACPAKTEMMMNSGDSSSSGKQRIPMIVHQTARTRCLTPAFHEVCSKWKFPDYEYWFHDDKAVNRLLSLKFPEFPLLHNILRNCVTSTNLKTTLWQYLVVYKYGGTFAPFGSAPDPKEFKNAIAKDDDALFIAGPDSTLRQGFMAVSPRHPLVYYAIHHILLNLLEKNATTRVYSDVKMSLDSLQKAFNEFSKDAGSDIGQVFFGRKIVGTSNRTVTVVGEGQKDAKFVLSLAVDPVVRRKDYHTMGMSDLMDINESSSDKLEIESCMTAILKDVSVAPQ